MGGLIPVSILVSCKRYKRKVNQQQMDAFLGEWRSSRAHVGVIYSYSGFTKPALEKARANRVSCCRLYVDEPPDIPEVVLFTCYLWQPLVRVHASGHLSERPSLTWQDLYFIRDEDGSLLEQLEHAWKEAADGALKAIEGGKARPNLVVVRNLAFDASGDLPAFEVKVTHRWRLFRARETAYSVNGSYSESDKAFIGSATSPSIDTWSSEPGPGWQEVPSTSEIAKNSVHLMAIKAPVEDALVASLGPKRVFPDAS